MDDRADYTANRRSLRSTAIAPGGFAVAVAVVAGAADAAGAGAVVVVAAVVAHASYLAAYPAYQAACPVACLAAASKVASDQTDVAVALPYCLRRDFQVAVVAPPGLVVASRTVFAPLAAGSGDSGKVERTGRGTGRCRWR